MNPLVLVAARAAHRALSSPMRPPRNWRLEGSLDLAPLGKARWRAVLDPADALRLRHVPTGRCLCPAFREMETDLASVPGFLQHATRGAKAVHLQADSFPASCVFHDAGYTAAFCWTVENGLARRAPLTRAQADALLFLCLCCQGATGYDAVAYYNGVRLGGASHWKAARREEPKWPLLFGGSAAGEPAHAVAAHDQGPRAEPNSEAVVRKGEDQGGQKGQHQQDGNEGCGFHGVQTNSTKSFPKRQAK